MGELLLTNIFFAITAIAVLFVTFLVCFILYQVFRITRAFRRIIERIDEGTEGIIEDVEALKRHLTRSGLVGRVISGVFSGYVNHGGVQKQETRRTARKSRRTKKSVSKEEK